MECVFCKIINKEIPSYTIYEDDLVVCFLDINPDSVGHTLVVPKRHVVDITDMDEVLWGHILLVVKSLYDRFNRLGVDGLTLVENNGFIQEVKHFHLHLKPYYIIKKDMDIKEVYELLKD